MPGTREIDYDYKGGMYTDKCPTDQGLNDKQTPGWTGEPLFMAWHGKGTIAAVKPADVSRLENNSGKYGLLSGTIMDLGLAS
ncbi:hypothetical protein BDY21DRAFT_341423 [Lineolata rhizophorae]|uniref:Uncharacterized protein n=1 Tax=Lineolata rhizophorae TaxID=578093 RepID=A0A6A6P503_9PEZI|nr:hypothetical protein BDY21DRAFT_341423 [Lineolata rhizophorae]